MKSTSSARTTRSANGSHVTKPVIAGVAAATAVAAIAHQVLPDIRRYLRMRRM